jgi:hypothetical protein
VERCGEHRCQHEDIWDAIGEGAGPSLSRVGQVRDPVLLVETREGGDSFVGYKIVPIRINMAPEIR